MRKLFIVFLFAALAVHSSAQPKLGAGGANSAVDAVEQVAAAPSGTCTQGARPRQTPVVAGGFIYDCLGGFWKQRVVVTQVSAAPCGACDQMFGQILQLSSTGALLVCELGQWVNVRTGAAGCTSNPSPTLSAISPNSASAGAAAFTLSLTGTGFVSGSVVRWAGADRTTTYVSATQLTAQVLAGDVTSVGTASVTVFNPTPGGGTSGGQTFTIGTAPSGYYVAATGADGNPCTIGSPCSLAKAFGMGALVSPVTAGSTIYGRDGDYVVTGAALTGTETEPFKVFISGTSTNHITLIPYPGESMRIRGGIEVNTNVSYVDFDGAMRGVIYNTAARPAATTANDAGVRPAGFDVRCTGCSFRNWVIVGTGGGIHSWEQASGLYENCLLYNIGFAQTLNYPDDVGNGFGLYIQNGLSNPRKYFRNMMGGENGRGFAKAYTEGSYANKVTWENFKVANSGDLFSTGNYSHAALFIGVAGANPMIDNEIINCNVYQGTTKNAPALAVGYSPQYSTGSVITGNYLVSNGYGSATFSRQRNMVFTSNTLINQGPGAGGISDVMVDFIPDTGYTFAASGNTFHTNTYWNFDSTLGGYWFNTGDGIGRRLFNTAPLRPSWQDISGYDLAGSAFVNPSSTIKTQVTPFMADGVQYAYVWVANWPNTSTANVDLSSFISAGQTWSAWHYHRYVNTVVFDGTPVTLRATPDQTGTTQTAALSMTNGLYGNKNALFVIKKT